MFSIEFRSVEHAGWSKGATLFSWKKILHTNLTPVVSYHGSQLLVCHANIEHSSLVSHDRTGTRTGMFTLVKTIMYLNTGVMEVRPVVYLAQLLVQWHLQKRVVLLTYSCRASSRLLLLALWKPGDVSNLTQWKNRVGNKQTHTNTRATSSSGYVPGIHYDQVQ